MRYLKHVETINISTIIYLSGGGTLFYNVIQWT